MTEDTARLFKADVASIPQEPLEPLPDDQRGRHLVAQTFLRLWTRLALETGRRLRMRPSQYHIGTYKGKMNWVINEGCLDGVDRIELADEKDKAYMLVAEMYASKGEPRTRVFFSLREDEVKGKPVYVNYLVNDQALKDFRLEAMVDSIVTVLPRWADALISGETGPLVDQAKERYECVGA